MSRVFAYSPLTEPDHIRLLLLQPAVDRDDDLEGSLHHLSLNDHYHDLIDNYTALSYVWGDPRPADTIILDGQPFGITANLGAALRDLRDATRTHRIWADAVCIDQNNIPERNQQVLLMGSIYSRANKTVIYLGALTSHAEVVVRQATRRIHLGVSEEHLSDSQTISEAATKEVLTKPWFYRVWVLQELVLSREPWVQFGSKRIRWDDLCCLLIPLLRKGREDDVTVLENMNKIRTEYWNDHRSDYYSSSFADFRPGEEEYRSSGNRKLCNILDTRKGCQTTDPRDIIFAHLGIISDKAEALKYIKVDYSQLPSEVFIATARYVRKNGGNFYLMQNWTDCRTNSPLPSWVPDWGTQISRDMVQQGPKKPFSTPFTSSSRAEPFQIRSSQKILDVSSVLSSVSLDWEDLFMKVRHFPGDIDPMPWKEFVDILGDAGIDRIAIEETVSSWRNRANDRPCLSIQHRIAMAIRRYSGELGLGSPPAPSLSQMRLALLNEGTVVAVPQTASSGDFVVCVCTSWDDISRFPTNLSRHFGIGNYILVRPYTSPLVKACEVDYVAKYEAALSGDDGEDCYRSNVIMFLHGLFVGMVYGLKPDKLRETEAEELSPDLMSDWSAYDVTGEPKVLFGQHDSIRVLFLH